MFVGGPKILTPGCFCTLYLEYMSYFRDDLLLLPDIESIFTVRSPKETSRRKRNLNLISFSLITTLSLIAAFAWWQMNQTQKFLGNKIKQQYLLLLEQAKKAESSMDYGGAAVVYENILLLVDENPRILNAIDKDQIRSEVRYARARKESEGLFHQLLAQGDALRDKGHASMIDAIEKYEQAASLDFNSEVVEARLAGIGRKELSVAWGALESTGDRFAKAFVCDEAGLRFREALNILSYMHFEELVEETTYQQATRRLKRKLEDCK